MHIHVISYIWAHFYAGKYYQTRNERIIGDAASETARFREKAEWLGMIAGPSAALVLNSANEDYKSRTEEYRLHFGMNS